MPQNPEKEYDRKARLLFVIHLLNNNPHGLTLKVIADRCNVCIRTTRRDLRALEAEFDAKLGREDGRWVLLPGAVLPPVLFKLPEAMAIFMAARLLLAQSSVYNHDIETTFTKLATVVPPTLRGEITKTLEWMRRRRPDEAKVKVLNIISRCWTERRQVRVKYWTLNAHSAEERVIEPYFIQPSALDHAVYIFAFCHIRNGIRTFRLDRISEALALDEAYEIPESFNANEYLNKYLGVTAAGEPKTVQLRFRPEVARVATETTWHDSQVTALQTDGSAVVTMKLALTRDLTSFILGWVDMVEVLQPPDLRRKVTRAARQMQALYERQDADRLPDSARDDRPGADDEEPEAGPTLESGSVQLRLFDDSASAAE